MTANAIVEKSLEQIHNRHISFLKDFLAGEIILPIQIWLSVGYFKYGNGRSFFENHKPFSEEEWECLLAVTGRAKNS